MSTPTMNLLELKTLICEECGRELTPKLGTVRGSIVFNDCRVQYWHPPNVQCSKSEWVVEVFVPRTADGAKVVGKMDFRTLPEKLVPIE